ncbi:BTB/POZ and MATH domain-containing protein 4 [Sesamum angolense]|uniref:BTB/POZ and MATH domain-containing protein 4 n=1 Tax=Sesamum angolense TaxID=2727404 RepID=A0AAE1XBG6_9LAMI|nr:BTB/POZ and MATH domain-containing protein 4 [Sesamum angolense]
MGIGKHIASDDFTVGGYKWAIYFYPDGKNPEDNSTYVSVFIALASEGTDVRALFELTLVDQSGRGKHKVHSHFDRSLESGPYTLKYRGSMWLVPDSDIGSHIGTLLENMEGSDIIFNVSGENFHAHKLVLAARSPKFRSEFFESLDTDDQEIMVSDMEPKVFKRALYDNLFLDSFAAVMRSDGFEYLKENYPALQSELLKTVAGCDDDCSSGGGKSRSVWAQLSDGGDTSGRRVRQRT